MASRRRFELLACPLGGDRSIQLSYRDAGWVVYQQRAARLVFFNAANHRLRYLQRLNWCDKFSYKSHINSSSSSRKPRRRLIRLLSK